MKRTPSDHETREPAAGRLDGDAGADSQTDNQADTQTDSQPDSQAEDEIRLDDALKLLGVAATGGHAKALVQAGEVSVNGAIETRRKRKLHAGDVIAVGGETYVVAFEEDEAE